MAEREICPRSSAQSRLLRLMAAQPVQPLGKARYAFVVWSVRPSVRLSVRPSVRPYVRPPVRLLVRPSVRPSLPVCLSVLHTCKFAGLQQFRVSYRLQSRTLVWVYAVLHLHVCSAVVEKHSCRAAWTSCSVTCKSGTRTRTREIDTPQEGFTCAADGSNAGICGTSCPSLDDSTPCELGECDCTYGSWTTWTVHARMSCMCHAHKCKCDVAGLPCNLWHWNSQSHPHYHQPLGLNESLPGYYIRIDCL